ncbi:hypothetical protein KP509_29G082000 [Ceratopteris richardii]|nr:hypothetical protein KP509_29G082000 [Ceratopteris richardii]
MLSDGVCPNAYTFSCVLRSCASTRSIDMGIKIHGDIEEMEQVRSNPYVCNALVDMYMKCGMSLKAREVFKCNPVRDVVSWTSLVVGCIMEGQCEEAMNCFKQMQSEGFQPNAISFTCMLNACSYTNAVKEGRALHAEIEKKGLHESDLLVGTALVNMYMKCGLLDKGLEVFNKLPVQDLVTWTALIVGYVGHADVEEAFMYYSQMQVEGFFPDSITMTSVLKACSGLGRAQVGKEVHTRLLAMELLDKDATLCNGLISMYAKYGLLADAQKVFNNTQTHDVISWTALIMGYAQSGDVDDVTCLFDEMISKGIRPDSVTFITVLNACSHSGLVEKGQTYFEAMSEVYGLVPISRHHACMIDLHCRMGQIAEAVALAYRLPFHPCSSMWRRLLSACQNLRELEYGSHLFEQSVQANDNDAALYVFMGNIMTMSRYKVQLPEYV